jgi:steroid delta-isomerase-like uncharacterized protein
MTPPVRLIAAGIAVSSWACSTVSDRTRTHNIEVVRLQHAEIWSQGRIDLVPKVYAEDVVGHFPAGTVRGREGIRARVEAHRTAFPDWTEVIDDVIADGDQVVTRFTSRGTNLGEFLGAPATGRRVEITEVCVYRLAEGKIVELWVYPDMIGMQRQLGARSP